ncbi:MAG: sodium:solute symporter [Pseudomonadota bacterium]
MQTPLNSLDWAIIAGYAAAVIIGGFWLSRRSAGSLNEYFLAGNTMSPWVVMFSVLATTQSAATFLGGPDYGYRGDFTYLGSFLGAALAAIVVAKVLITRFYALGVTTVYELLNIRYGDAAKRAAGAMYLVGRVFANGARLYMAAVAVSMMLFFNIEAQSIIAAIILITLISIGITLAGGVRSVIWSDFGQFIVYFSAALIALMSLWGQLGLSVGEIINALRDTPDETNKLVLFDFGFDLSKPFSFWAVITGVFLLYLGNFGLDQDTTQRLLTCKNAKEGGRALIGSAIIAIPIVFVFVLIGQLLYLFYHLETQNIDSSARISTFDGEAITVFMAYILSEMPSGVRGLATAGVVAAAISTMTSGLNAMSSVLISDFYKPWKERRAEHASANNYVPAGRIGMVLFAALLAAMATLCFYWQRYTDMALLEFALSVMAFAYAGLLGVFFVAVFTTRGSTRSVIAALITGFIAIVIQQSYVVDVLGLPAALKSLAFPWQLLIGSSLAGLVCFLGNQTPKPHAPSHNNPNISKGNQRA